jgi:YfiH family protein
MLDPFAEGELNLGFNAQDSFDAVTANRRRWRTALAGKRERLGRPTGLVTLKQMHSSLTRRVGAADARERASLWGDGLITDEPGVLLGIQTADCLPILIADTRRRAVGAFHAGWRGTLKGVVERGIESMRKDFGSEPRDMVAAIGPGIGPCCFEVGDEVRRPFAERYSYAPELFSAEGKPRLDLVEANRRQLLSAGLSPEAVFAIRECTSCRTDLFFSYRAEHGRTGRMMAGIGIRDCQ